ncbi:glycosyltransferase family 4 protein [Nodularia harveyana UHCC-0300]|uniref:Glycosyltransferase family 4 protein n=1 Tax=Nodularia harveyana UHCC-0300 TaxID=2974287 RepID=A0ABU5UCM0_9CYAN|nr:glycosyltransferase family 4 protein [Nodularia harveyana]MEA5581257.1 glycosyltransferase family 4 protein [Nodularia harveyana UHCC-0300]
MEIKIKKLYLINSTFPPQISGVGDHTAYLATELAKILEVKVLVAFGEIDNFTQFKVEQIFSYVKPESFFSIIKFIREDPPDWVILQYDPFGYGMRYGLNPYIPLAINILKRLCPQVKIGVIVHESFIHIRNKKLAVLAQFLKAQLWLLGCAVDTIFTVIEPWVPILNSWFPNKLIQHLPVSSNIPQVPTDRDKVRESLGISPQTIVIGLFGRIQRVRRLDHIINAVNQTIEAGFDVLVMYIGHDSAPAKSGLGNLPLLAEGPFSPEEVSRRFAAMDIYLVPIDEGVSTRNTSFMTGLQHGIPTVATFGSSTDSMLMQEQGKALFLVDVKAPDDFAQAVLELASNPLRRKLLSNGAKELFAREFDWSHISLKLLNTLESF